MRRVIKFPTGEVAIVYKNSDIRTKLTRKQAEDLMNTRSIEYVKEKKEQLWIQMEADDFSELAV